MNYLYVSNLCSNAKLKDLFNNSKEKPAVQGMKYNRLLAEGLAYNNNNCVETISALQMSRKINKKIYIRGDSDFENSVDYHYLSFFNIPFLRHLFLFINSFIRTFLWKPNNNSSEKIVIGDVLSVSVSLGALLAAKCRRIKSVALVTDLPMFQNNDDEYKKGLRSVLAIIIRRVREYIMIRYDGYIILTEQMNKLVNPKEKPYIVIEGIADEQMSRVPNNLDQKYNEKVIIYAGSLKKKYGIKNFIDAFLKIETDNTMFLIYGKGEMANEIKELEKNYKTIKYLGMVPNEEVVCSEIRATLLINPRPTNEEFTKYSFPSKNMEYMSTGTPVLTTILPGMPKEYYDYVYLIRDETVEGIANTLNQIINKPIEELHETGLKAKQFVLKEKNNIIQARKIDRMIKEIFQDNTEKC